MIYFEVFLYVPAGIVCNIIEYFGLIYFEVF